jgi:hypothetical protein
MSPSLARVSAGTLFVCLLLTSACTGTAGREGITPSQAHMYAHFDRAGELHNALVRGDLEQARTAANWIASHQERQDFTGESARQQDVMRAFAERVGSSDHLREATQAAAQMGQACGDCHRENQVEPRFLIGTAPPGGSGPKAEMARHVWASERMWEGLVGPGDRAWNSGAEALRSGWLDTHEVVADPGDQAHLRELVRHIYDLGGRAGAASDPRDRAVLYGEFLNTCTECHRLTEAKIG